MLETTPPAVTLLESSQQRIVLRLGAPDGALLASALDGPARGVERSTRPEALGLPVVALSLGIPAEAEIELRVLSAKTDLLPAPAALASRFPQHQLTPATPALLGSPAWLRNQRIVGLELYPLQYDPASQHMRWLRELTVELHWASSPPQTTAHGADAGPFETLLRASLLNYQAARAWRVEPAPLDLAQPDLQTPRCKLVVNRDGLYRVGYAELSAAGCLSSNSSASFSMSSQGQPVAISVDDSDGSFGPGDSLTFYGRKFYGSLQEQKYTDENVYWLSAGGSPGPRIALESGAPSGQASSPTSYTLKLHREESRRRRTGDLSTEDSWLWEEISVSKPLSATRIYTASLSALASAPFSATVSADILFETFNAGASPDHHTRFVLNSHSPPLDDTFWDGYRHHQFTTQVPHTALLEGLNQLRVTLLTDGTVANERAFFNWFEITYQRRFVAEAGQLLFSWQAGGHQEFAATGFLTQSVQIYDVSDPLLPRRITQPAISLLDPDYRVSFERQSANGTYLIVEPGAILAPARILHDLPSDLRSPDNRADYLLITHQSFYTSALRLADYRAGQGLRSMVVDVDDLYDEFNEGIYSPTAIKNFLRYAYTSWQKPAPAYVVLIGDGHYDFKYQLSGSVLPQYMPPNMAWVDPFDGEVDSANQLVTLVGDDNLPEMAIGRMPVTSTLQLETIISKTIAFEATPYQQRPRTIALLSDNYLDSAGNPDVAGNFPALAEMVDTLVPASYTVTKIYYDPYPPNSSPYPNIGAARDALFQAVDEGQLFISYVGHASITSWAGEGLLTTSHLNGIDNQQLPIIFSLACLDGFWFHPRIGSSQGPSLAERWLWENGGAVATFSPTGLGLNTGHSQLARGFYQAYFSHGARDLAAATLAAKVAVYQHGGSIDLVDTFTIFGDPALRLQQPRTLFPLLRQM